MALPGAATQHTAWPAAPCRGPSLSQVPSLSVRVAHVALPAAAGCRAAGWEGCVQPDRLSINCRSLPTLYTAGRRAAGWRSAASRRGAWQTTRHTHVSVGLDDVKGMRTIGHERAVGEQGTQSTWCCVPTCRRHEGHAHRQDGGAAPRGHRGGATAAAARGRKVSGGCCRCPCRCRAAGVFSCLYRWRCRWGCPRPRRHCRRRQRYRQRCAFEASSL